MAMSRSFGGTLLTTRSPIAISPRLISSRPAIIRSKVDLPQPEGPTRTTNSPSGMLTETPCRTWRAVELVDLPDIDGGHPCVPCGAAAWRIGRCARDRCGLRSPNGARSVDGLWRSGPHRATREDSERERG